MRLLLDLQELPDRRGRALHRCRAEVDYYWERLTADGGEEGPCGWCKDRFGLSWQVIPAGFDEIFADPDRDRATRAMKAMFGMKKLDLAAMLAAADSTD